MSRPPWYNGGVETGTGAAVSVRGAFLVALVVALAASAMALGPGRALHPPGTFVKYLEAARSQDTSRLADYSPLYLALVRTLDRAGGVRAIRAVQVAFFAATAVLVALAVLLESGPWAALAAGLAVACYRPFLVYVPVLEPEPLLLFLLALALAGGAWARSAAGPTASPRRRIVLAALAGTGAGLAALVRPQYLLLVPAVALWTGWEGGRRIHRGSVLTVFLAGTVIVTPPVILRMAEGGTVAVMSPGTVFYEGNGPQSPTGRYTVPELVRELQARTEHGADLAHVFYREVAAASTGTQPSPGLASRHWAGLALAGMRARPLRAAGRFFSKAVLAAGPFELHDLVNAEDLDRRLRPVLPWGFGLLLAAVVWVAPALRSRAATAAGALLVALLAFGIQVAFYPSARQRLPLALALLLLWGLGLTRRKERWSRQVLRAALALGLWFMVAWLASADASDHATWLATVLGPERPSAGSRLAAVLDGRALRPEARTAARAVESARDRRDLGLLPRSTLEPELTRAVLAKGSVPPWLRARAAYHLARACAAEGRPAEARRWARIATTLDPDHLPSLALRHALAHISHQLPAADGDVPATLALLPATPPATCPKHASAASWSKTHTDRHLRALATKVGEKCGPASPDCPPPLQPVPPGYDPLDALFVTARELALTHGPLCARATAAPLTAAFPTLAQDLPR